MAVRPLDLAAVMNDPTPLGAVKRAAVVRVAPATREVRVRVIPVGEALASTKPANGDPAARCAADDQESRADARVSTKSASDDPAPLLVADDQVSRADARVSTKPANDDPLLALAAHDRADPAAQVQATISHDALR